MGNPFNKADPWETSLENLTGQAAKAGASVKKAADTAAVTLGKDIKEQVFGEPVPETNQAQNASQEQIKEGEKQGAEEKKQINIARTRENLQGINMEIRRIREEKLKKDKERLKSPEQTQKPGEKKTEEGHKKQEKESLLQKMLKGKQGSREIGKGVSG